MKNNRLIRFLAPAFSLVCLASCSQTQYVNFYNFDGTLLWQTTYSEGMSLVYGGETPKKDKDDVYEYTFTGWNHSLYEVGIYKNFYAQFDRDFRTFSVTFCDYDNSLISTIQTKYGTSVLDKVPSNPSKPNTDREHFYFSGWGDVDLSYITADVRAVAEYSTTPCYKIDFLDYDNTLLHTEYVEEGLSSSYTIDKSMAVDSDHYYVFSNWSVSVDNVRCDLKAVAEYKIVNACTVTFKNYDETVLGTDKGPEGFTAKYNGSTPTKSGYTSGYYIYSYSFSGWDISLENIKNNKTAIAQFSQSSTYYNADYENALDEIRTKAKDGTYSSDTGRYYKGFDAYVTSTKIIAGYGEVDASTDVVDLYYALTTYQSGFWAGGSVTIYFKPHKPGTYNVFYKYAADGSTVAFGYFDIYDSFSSSSSVSFNGFTNLSTSTTESQHASLARNLVSTCLTSAKSCSWIDTKSLGFSNY